ncbi:MAG: LON peptidase substrate-binding domain-containing protein [Pseudomonadales bacterium]|jgi:Lon protease-like protein|nr:LON peptidase substrate-binding domain-containing protein [Pseudomonadales bacterium]MDG1441497.1 LON peptidase substrate-binding domain-containing protein [Pseudomonadales bacterium]
MEVALFPIPDIVTFPGTVVPLHVFEPRYRQMIHDAVERNMMIGVCHTRKQIRAAKSNMTQVEALSTNQATYLPQTVFSAGYCHVTETSEDGRIFANIVMEQRFQLGDEIQTLPYRINNSTPYNDKTRAELELEQAPNSPDIDYAALQALITERLLVIIGDQNPGLVAILKHKDWSELTPETFSFRIFQFLHLDADVMQDILEMRQPGERLTFLAELLTPA